MKKIITTSLVVFVAISAFAQMGQPTANLTIFSEDGLKFFLILNGERQNDKAQTNLRVEELAQPYYNAKIIFEDKTQGEISKNTLMLTDANGTPQDVTYKIKKDKNGKNVLRFFSNIPVQPNYLPPSNMTVYHYGNPAPVVIGTTTTVTETTTGVGSGVNVNMGGMGVNVNVNVNDPTVQSTTTYSTTTTTTHSGYQAPPRSVEPARPSGCAGYAMAPGDFASAKETIRGSDFEATKLSTAKQIALANCLYADQVAEICRLFDFENSKLDFAKTAYGRCIDKSNYFKVNAVFDFDNSKEELSKYTSGR